MLIEKGAVSRAIKTRVSRAETRAYTVVRDFWHAGVLRVEGDVIHLTDAAAKYFRHALERAEGKAFSEAKAVAVEVATAVERPFRAEGVRPEPEVDAPEAHDADRHDADHDDVDHGEHP